MARLTMLIFVVSKYLPISSPQPLWPLVPFLTVESPTRKSVGLPSAGLVCPCAVETTTRRRLSSNIRIMVIPCVLVLSAAVGGALEFKNPLIRQRADPWVLRHSDGNYYFTASVPEYDRIILRRANT